MSVIFRTSRKIILRFLWPGLLPAGLPDVPLANGMPVGMPSARRCFAAAAESVRRFDVATMDSGHELE